MSIQEDAEIHKPSFLTTTWFWGILIVLALVGGGSWILFSQSVISASTAGNNAGGLEPAAVPGHPAPNFELKDLHGETIRLSDFEGKPVLVNFWATWCGPCRAEFPDFQEASIENADNLVIIGINHTTADQPDQVEGFVTDMGATFPIVLDETGETAEIYKVRGLPTSIFIDRNGVVNEVFTGPINKAYIESKLNEL